MDLRVFIFLLVIWAKVEASNTTTRSGWTVLLKVFENCADKNDSLTCLQQKVLNFANRMTQSKSLEIFEGLKFVQDEGIGRSISDPESTNSGTNLSDQIWSKIWKFFNTHSVEVNLPRFLDTDNEARKKKGGNGGMLLLAGAVKGAMIYMGMHAVAALAGKALIVAKIALTIASVIALKKLLEGGSGKTSYEIIKHPQHSYVQTHSSSHEYGGGGGSGGHGGGYEGHYRKRSIAKTRFNVNQEFARPAEFREATDSWRFKLPKQEPGIKFSTNPNKSEQTDSAAPDEQEPFFSIRQTVDQSEPENFNNNPFAANIGDENGSPEFGAGTSNKDDGLSLVQTNRLRLKKFV